MIIHKKRWIKNPHGGSTFYTACGMKMDEVEAKGEDSITKRQVSREGIDYRVDCEKCIEIMDLGRVKTIVQCSNCGIIIETPKVNRPKVYPRDRLSDREAEIAACIVRGFSNRKAADKLHITEKTVKYHLTAVYQKLRIDSRSELINGWFANRFDAVSLSMILDYLPDENVEEESKPQEPETGGEAPLPGGI